MRTITVSVPDDVYRRATMRAAERGQSLSTLVVELLNALSASDAEFARLEALQQKVQAQIRQFAGTDRLDRDAVHERSG